MRKILVCALAAICLAACGSSQAGNPSKVVEAYLRAKASADESGIRQHLCSAMEAELPRELNTFKGLTGVKVEGLACQAVEGSDVVKCSGKIVAVYGTEQSEFPLTAYRVVQENSEWKWCGEANLQ
jgi:hypothetical protein